MFPYHDENETQRPAYVTMALVAINVLVWIAGPGRRGVAAARDVGLQPRPHPGRADRRAAARRAGSRWATGSSA